SQQAGSILVQLIDSSTEAIAYRMPKVLFTDQYAIVDIKDILCAVNVQHHCVGRKCLAVDSRPVYQERHRKEGATKAAIRHESPEDLVLNTAQMRNAVLVQQFRIPSPTLNAQEIIMKSVQKEIAVRK
ncbi:hypothetical protein BT96DRAFT_758157, partial [Gymnopus androsaceus JB14]